MEATQTANPPTFESVWAGLQEVRQTLRESAERHREIDRILKENSEEQKERHKEIDRIMKENAEEQKERQKETDRIIKETDKRIGKLGNRFGEMIEYMVMPNLVKRFREMGFGFTEAYPHSVIEDEENNIFTEVDITLTNGEKRMIVEVKSKPTTEDIIEHVRRMEKIRTHANLHGHKRQFLGAVAGMVFNNKEKTFALKNGFYVIEPSGDTFTVTVPEGIYSPQEW
ncbi:MAG: hypothetical protein LBI28_06665 [Treponema sp.]|jgi:hypothetical protein|nr:hypothetical protein [Treponema sp.]